MGSVTTVEGDAHSGSGGDGVAAVVTCGRDPGPGVAPRGQGDRAPDRGVEERAGLHQAAGMRPQRYAVLPWASRIALLAHAHPQAAGAAERCRGADCGDECALVVGLRDARPVPIDPAPGLYRDHAGYAHDPRVRLCIPCISSSSRRSRSRACRVPGTRRAARNAGGTTGRAALAGSWEARGPTSSRDAACAGRPRRALRVLAERGLEARQVALNLVGELALGRVREQPAGTGAAHRLALHVQ